jgi:PGF-CTERM protein
VENFTVGEGDVRASVGFEGGQSVALKPATATPAAPGNQTDVGTYVTVSRSGDDTTLDSLTVHYENASGVNESTLTLWQYDPSTDSWSEFDDPNGADPAANAVTAEGILGGDMDNSDVVVAPVGDAHADVNASLVANPTEAEVDNTSVTLNASETSTDGDAEYRWDVDGNGTVDEVTDNATTTHTYTSTGEYTATVTVVDGGTEDTATATVNVTDGDDGSDGGDGSDSDDSSDGSDGDDGGDGSDGGDNTDDSGGQTAGGGQAVTGENVMTVDVAETDDGVTATVRDGSANESVDVALADYNVSTSQATFERLSTTLTADADGRLAVRATGASPLADDAATESFEPVSYLTITETLPLDDESFRFGIDDERLDALDAEPSDVTAMVHTDDGWERVGTEVVITADGRAFDVDADGVDNDTVLAVGVDRPAVDVAAVAASDGAEAGDAVPVDVTVTNDGATAGTTTVALRVDGEERTARNVTVPDGESVTVTFEPTFEEAGTYEVAAGNATASVSVSEAPTTTEQTTAATTAPTSEATEVEAASTEGQPGFGLAVALVALAAAALLALRRRR